MNNWKTPDPKMAGFITVVLLLLFAFSFVAPVINVGWLIKDVHFDAGNTSTLQNVLLLAIVYYIGTSKSSDDKTAIIATQAATAAAASPNGPTGKPDDPVTVTEAKP